MSKKLDVHYASDKMDWVTPMSLFTPLQEEFDLTWDVACTSDNCRMNPPGGGFLFDRGMDGLAEHWDEWATACWMNPPYGRELSKWVQKAWDEKHNGVTTVMLVPARTDTKWWATFWSHEFHRARDIQDEVRFLKGRIKFEGAEHGAPFPSAIVILKGVSKEI